MKVALVSAIYGGYDAPNPLLENHGFDEAIIISDNPRTQANGWTTRVEPRGNLSPRLASKFPKFQPFDYVDADIAVWIDGAGRIKSPEYRQFCVDSLGDNDVMAWAHPERNPPPERAARNCLYDEALFCQDWLKYRDYPIPAQTAYYREQGMPENFGLWACGSLVWRNTTGAREFGRLWLLENIRWSIQDQVSFPYLVWKHQPKLIEFPVPQYGNDYIQWNFHRSEL